MGLIRPNSSWAVTAVLGFPGMASTASVRTHRVVFVRAHILPPDVDACVDHPCDQDVSQCIDDKAPSLGYRCACMEGFSAKPGFEKFDGSGCGMPARPQCDV